MGVAVMIASMFSLGVEGSVIRAEAAMRISHNFKFVSLNANCCLITVYENDSSQKKRTSVLRHRE